MSTKTLKPKIKVEELVKDEIPKESTVEEKPGILEPAKTTAPKIASFSQLDNVKGKDVTSDNPSSEDVQEVESAKTIQAPSENKEEVKTSSPEESAEEDENTENMSSQDIREWLKDIRPDTTKEVEKKSSFNFNLFFIMLLVFGLLGALVGGIFYYKNNVTSLNKETETPPIVETATPAPTETPEIAVDLKKYNVSVLNGSGTPGLASSVKTELVKAGFSEDKIKTSNADSYNFKNTEVSFKKDIPGSVFETIKTSLEKTYNVTKVEEILKDTSSFDIIIVVGKKK